MNKQFALKRYQVILFNLHRFDSHLDDVAATCILLGRATGFLDGLYSCGVITGDELLFLQELAYSAHQYARRVA